MAQAAWEWKLGSQTWDLIQSCWSDLQESLLRGKSPEKVFDPLELSRNARTKQLDTQSRAWVWSQVRLRYRAQEKFPGISALYWTEAGLEMATRKTVGIIKAKYLKNYTAIVDLCCGLGGDSFFLDTPFLMGVDRDEWVLRLYEKNMTLLGKKPQVVLADAEFMPLKKFDCLLVDPARRSSSGHKHGQSAAFSPHPEAIVKLARNCPHLFLKWSPALPHPLPSENSSQMYLGEGDSCQEQWVIPGHLVGPQRVGAIECLSGREYWANLEDTYLTLPTSPPQAFLYEPLKSLIAAKLHPHLARSLNIAALDVNTAYLTGQEKLNHPWLKTYAILKVWDCSWNQVQKEIKKMGFGDLTIKQRGWGDRAPQTPAGRSCPDNIFLVFCLVQGKRNVLLVQSGAEKL